MFGVGRLTRGIESPRAAHEAGAATGIVNVGVTRADDFVSLKINARLGEVQFCVPRFFSVCIPLLLLPIFWPFISYRYCPGCFIWGPLASLPSNNITSGICFIFTSRESMIYFSKLFLEMDFNIVNTINSTSLLSDHKICIYIYQLYFIYI